jgi:hypothetical protein
MHNANRAIAVAALAVLVLGAASATAMSTDPHELRSSPAATDAPAAGAAAAESDPDAPASVHPLAGRPPAATSSETATADARPVERARIGGLGAGDAIFWDGVTVGSGQVKDPALCGAAGSCFEYPLRLTAAGARLRVAIDTPDRGSTFDLEVHDAAGAVLASVTNSNQFNAEAFVDKPAAGAYTVVVRPVDVANAFFRMRAKLEATRPGTQAGRVAMLPNLRAVPPYEFGFTAPLTPNGSYPPDRANPPAAVLGQTLYSCTPDESAPVDLGGGGANDCLRLTSGPMNVGSGPFDMRFTFVEDLADGTADAALLRGPIFQAVHHSDGTQVTRPAGSYTFHTTHAHFHDENILTYDLFKVTNPRTGARTKAGAGTKSGFCPADQLFGDWQSFSQAIRGDFGEGDTPTGSCFSPTDGLLGLTSGWGDVYRWQRPGQYVEFGGQGDGLYVVQATVDKANHIAESNDRDNVSYALIKVVGRSVQLIERGRGTSPWDPRKVVYRGSGPASRS